MTITDLHNQRVAILGLGQEGQAVARYLSKHGVPATILEKIPEDQWDSAQHEASNLPGMTVVSGDDYLRALVRMQVIFRSPGFWRLHPELLAAEKAGAIVTSQAKWFFEHHSGKIIGVTGTKGKGTTCSLIYQILRLANLPGQIYLTGNIGKHQPLECLDALASQDLVVYELSSFQLQDLHTSPDIGVCLMVTTDHLDHHQNLAEYHGAKSAISKFQTPKQIAIYNTDYTASKILGEQGQGQKFQISKKSAPEHGALIGSEEIIISGVAEESITIHTQQRKLRGQHNLENIAAASLAAAILQVPKVIIEQAVTEFTGLEHRLQLVDTVNGVAYYNDSISTVEQAAIAAVSSFTEPLILLLGGYDNNQPPYAELVAFLCTQSHIKAIVLIGQTAARLETMLKQAGFNKPIISGHDSFQQALEAATNFAEPGEVILLSPASKSFDMFKSYVDRGNQFINYVRSLIRS